MASSCEEMHSNDLFDDTNDLDFDDTKENGLSTAPHPVDGMSKDMDGDIERWLLDSLRLIIPHDMLSMYINKNNILFAFQKDPLSEEDPDCTTKWITDLTHGGKRSVMSGFDIAAPYTKIVNNRTEDARRRVALDYKTDPSFLRVIDPKTGKYILANLVRASAEQRAGLINYVEYVRKNIYMVPLLEELNRVALMQKIAYKGARKQLWFLLGLAEELKLVERTKTSKFKICIGKQLVSDFNGAMLDKRVTMKWLHGKPNASSLKRMPMDDQHSTTAPLHVVDSGDLQDSLFVDKTVAGESFLNSSLSEIIGQPLLEFKALDVAQDSDVQDLKLLNVINMTGSQTDLYDPTVAVSTSNIFTAEDSMGGNGNMVSFKGSISGNSWQMLEQLRKRKTKVANVREVDSVQKALDKIGTKRSGHEIKNAVNTVMVLEAACKLFGSGPKWSNPDKNEFDAGNKKCQLVYIKPPKNLNQNSIAYDYLMQYKSVHQKLNGGIRQQHAVSYGIITLGVAAPGEPITSYEINVQPWNEPTYAARWEKLGSNIGKSPPWIINVYQSPRKTQIDSAQRGFGVKCEQHEQIHLQQRSGETKTGDTDEHINSHMETQLNVKDTQVTSLEQEVNVQSDYIVNACYTHTRNVEPKQDLDVSIVVDNAAECHHCVEPEEGFQPQQAALMTVESTQIVEPVNECELDTAETDNKAGIVVPASQGAVVTEVRASEPIEAAVVTHHDGMAHNIQISGTREAEGPVQLVDGSMKQMKLTQLFRYVYTKMKKAKSLPECSPELLGRPKKQTQSAAPKSEQAALLSITGKRKRILDDEFTPEAFTMNYAPIHAETSASSNNSEDNDEDEKMTDSNVIDKAAEHVHKAKFSRREKIHKMREFLKNMFEVEAEESEDENLSDPEDIRKKLQMLKERLQHSSGESESEYESDTEVAAEMQDFLGEVDKFNAEDEELARQRFYADIQRQEENELAKLMPLKERSERELTRREERMKLLMQLKNAKNIRGINDLHLSDFESSDEEDGESRVAGKGKRRISKEELEQLLRFKTGQDQPANSISKTEELQHFVDYKLLTAKKPANETPIIRNQVERITKDRRTMMDSMLSSNLDSVIFGEGRDRTIANGDPFGAMPTSKTNVAAPTPFGPPKTQAAFVMKSFRWDQSMMKPLNSANIRNVGGFTGFHNLTSALKECQKQNGQLGDNRNGYNNKF